MHILILVHFTVLFHSQGGYYNSLILQSLELPPLARLVEVSWLLPIMYTATNYCQSEIQ